MCIYVFCVLREFGCVLWVCICVFCVYEDVLWMYYVCLCVFMCLLWVCMCVLVCVVCLCGMLVCVFVCLCVWCMMCVYSCAFCSTSQTIFISNHLHRTWGVLHTCGIDTVAWSPDIQMRFFEYEKKSSSIMFPNFNSLFTNHVWRMKTRSLRAENIPVNMTYTAIIGHLCWCYLVVSSGKLYKGNVGQSV